LELIRFVLKDDETAKLVQGWLSQELNPSSNGSSSSGASPMLHTPHPPALPPPSSHHLHPNGAAGGVYVSPMGPQGFNPSAGGSNGGMIVSSPLASTSATILLIVNTVVGAIQFDLMPTENIWNVKTWLWRHNQNLLPPPDQQDLLLDKRVLDDTSSLQVFYLFLPFALVFLRCIHAYNMK
jgi:hypothetical protein